MGSSCPRACRSGPDLSRPQRDPVLRVPPRGSEIPLRLDCPNQRHIPRLPRLWYIYIQICIPPTRCTSIWHDPCRTRSVPTADRTPGDSSILSTPGGQTDPPLSACAPWGLRTRVHVVVDWSCRSRETTPPSHPHREARKYPRTQTVRLEHSPSLGNIYPQICPPPTTDRDLARSLPSKRRANRKYIPRVCPVGSTDLPTPLCGDLDTGPSVCVSRSTQIETCTPRTPCQVSIDRLCAFVYPPIQIFPSCGQGVCGGLDTDLGLW